MSEYITKKKKTNYITKKKKTNYITKKSPQKIREREMMKR